MTWGIWIWNYFEKPTKEALKSDEMEYVFKMFLERCSCSIGTPLMMSLCLIFLFQFLMWKNGEPLLVNGHLRAICQLGKSKKAWSSLIHFVLWQMSVWVDSDRGQTVAFKALQLSLILVMFLYFYFCLCFCIFVCVFVFLFVFLYFFLSFCLCFCISIFCLCFIFLFL